MARNSKRLTHDNNPVMASLAVPHMQAPDSGIDTDALLAHLGALSAQGSSARNAILAHLKTTLEDAKTDARTRFEAGRLGGLDAARLIASIHDDIIRTLYDFTTSYIVRASNPTAAERMALCAVGGYGRGEMAPQSDVDLLFLLADKKGSAFTESVTEYMLYMLWDLGLKVGNATRTTDQCISLAKSDQTILTALLDVRFLCGDAPLADGLYTRFRKDITRGRGRAYIATKLAERDARHAREGNSRYVIEPNIKEGKGGLRDLHILYWIARYLDKGGKITDPQRAKDYVDMGLFEKDAATRFVRAADFLWRARFHLHYSAGRATESLSFDYQTVLARKMGHASGPIEEAVERFMREYFTNAREVGVITRIACAKLEAMQALRLPKGLSLLVPYSRRSIKEETGFSLDNGRLIFADRMQIRNDPSLIMKLFELAGRRNLDIHPDTFQEIDFRRNLIDTNFRRDPQISQIFQRILLKSKAPYATLKAMNETGVLGRYLLEFGGIVARTQFNMHHAYTVDEHTLRLVDNFHDLWRGELESENPIATEMVQGFSKEQRLILYLTCLLHDTGKGQGDQCIEGAQLARRACRRLGVSQEIKDTVAWLVRRHLDMSETAQRRDISDPDTVSEFCRLVGSKERLDLLYALTIVDIRAVGPGIWNDWKGSLLRGLYQASLNYLDGKEDLAPASKAAAAIEQLRERLPGNMGTRIRPVTDALGTQYWLSFDMSALVRHARFFDRVIQEGEDVAVQTRLNKRMDITELWVLGHDHKGLFADLTRTLSAYGASITGARLHTGSAGRVMNVFYLQNMDGLAFGRDNEDVLADMSRRALSALKGETAPHSTPQAVFSRRADAIPVRPRVKFIDPPSGEVTIIEIVGRDRPGLLSDLALCLQEDGIALQSAHIEVVGTRAIDAFYVKCMDHAGPLQAGKKARVKRALLHVLSPKKKTA